MQVIMRRWALGQVASGADGVMVGVPIPPGGTLNYVSLDVGVTPTVRLAAEAVVAYGITGIVLPVLDPAFLF